MRPGILIVLAAAVVVVASAGAARVARPDLVVLKASAPSSQLAPGARFVVRDTIVNRGGATAAQSQARYFILRAGKRVSLGVRRVQGLRPRKKASGKGRAKLPAKLATGRYALVVCADARGAVRESNERNNCATVRGAL